MNVKRSLQWLAFIAGIIALAVVILYSQHMMDAFASRPIIKQETPVVRPDVSVLAVNAERYQATVSAFGAAEARYNVMLSAQVSGQVTTLADDFETGKQVKKDAVLLQLENSDFRAAVAEAQQQLAEAELLFFQEKRQGQQSELEWQASGLSGEPDDLVLRKPQLAQAQAAVNNAKAQLVRARKDLDFTQIKAPFDALIVTRDVSPGSFVQSGTTVATLFSTDRVEIAVSLSEREWQSLPESNRLLATEWPVQIRAVEGQDQWQGRVLRSELHLDGTTRQRSLIIGVDMPLAQEPVFNPGTFVNVSLAGREREDLWQLPLTSLSQRGDIWYVDDANNLAKFASTPIFSDAEFIYIEPPVNLKDNTQQVLIQPIDSYLSGMAVVPKPVADIE